MVFVWLPLGQTSIVEFRDITMLEKYRRLLVRLELHTLSRLLGRQLLGSSLSEYSFALFIKVTPSLKITGCLFSYVLSWPCASLPLYVNVNNVIFDMVNTSDVANNATTTVQLQRTA